MKTKTLIASMLAIALTVAALAGCATSEQKQARLAAKAKITKAEAQKTALAKVPNGTVTEGELEEEKGKLIWSFDIATPGTKDITEVAVDAVTGEVVSVEKESAEKQSKEGKEEHEKKKEKDSDDGKK